MGLLSLGGLLRQHGFIIDYIDCLNRFHPKAVPSDPYKRHGRGPYHKIRIPAPKGLEEISRNFCRYGIEPEWFREDLRNTSKPDLIFVTSLMTYWHPGVRETISVIREAFPQTPVVLGGIYATLCRDHAIRFSGADRVVSGDGMTAMFELIEEYTDFSTTPSFDPADLNTHPFPCFDLQNTISYIPLMTSKGCPFHCAYCASHVLAPKWMVRSPDHILREIQHWHAAYGVRDFVFYDDALLVNAEKRIIPLLEGVIRAGLPLRFHTPNAVHVREITEPLADLMLRAGMTTLRLGLETTAFEKRSKLDRKVTESEFIAAAKALLQAGFDAKQVGAYLLAGLPNQSIEGIEASIRTVKESGITPILAYYTPIPHTRLWKEAVLSSRYDLESDPVFTNNAIFPCWPQGFSWEVMRRLKRLVKS